MSARRPNVADAPPHDPRAGQAPRPPLRHDEGALAGRPPCIAIVSHGALNMLAHRVSEAYLARAEVVFVERIFDAALSEIARIRRERPLDVLVSAGANGEFLRQHVGLPVTLVRVSGFDVLHALAAAKRLSDRVAVFTYHGINRELEAVRPMLDLEVVQSHYTGYDDAARHIDALIARGIEVFVGSSLVTELAERRGARGVLLYSETSMRNAIEDALSVARLVFDEELRRAELEAVLARLPEALVAVDASERIRVVNAAMAALIGRPAATLIGASLTRACAELSLRAVLARGAAETDAVVRLAGRTLVADRIPIVAGSAVRGALLTCRDAADVQRSDAALRRNARGAPGAARWRFEHIVGDSPPMRRARERAQAFARTGSTVLIAGETGTGKEMFAQAIHNASARSGGPFVAINCGAIPEALIESELFGHEEGAFTGSRRGGRTGLLESAHTGTVFLDEIAELPLSGQVRLLRALQERRVVRVGGNEPIPIDVRFVAATNRSLEALVRSGAFRSDLYYRIAVLTLDLPPLRERGADIEPLARRLLAAAASALDIDASDAALARAARALGACGPRDWPGNIRELQNAAERLVSLWAAAGARAPRTLRDWRAFVAGELASGARQPAAAAESRGEPPRLRPLRALARDAELERIRAALAAHAGNATQAARALGIGRSTLWRKLRGARAG